LPQGRVIDRLFSLRFDWKRETLQTTRAVYRSKGQERRFAPNKGAPELHS
jgi:hypothetical protein